MAGVSGKNSDSDPLDSLESVFIGDIVTDIYSYHIGTAKVKEIKYVKHCFAFIPVNIRLNFIDHFSRLKA